jgi:hypothetical protein
MSSATAAPPTACEYESSDGSACRFRARLRFTFVQRAVKGLSGEPVKFYAHACYGHDRKARDSVVDGILLESVEPF